MGEGGLCGKIWIREKKIGRGGAGMRRWYTWYKYMRVSEIERERREVRMCV